MSKWAAYRLAEQRRKTGSESGNRFLTAEDKENIQHCMDKSPDITIEEIREKLNLLSLDRGRFTMGITSKWK